LPLLKVAIRSSIQKDNDSVSHARPGFSVSENDAAPSASVRRRHGRVPRRHPPGLGGAVLVWFFAAVALAYCSSAQTDPGLQVYFSAGLVLAMFVFKRMNPGQ